MENILVLDDVERFAFVMTVCERFSDQECSVLLSCSPQHVREVRLLALQKLGTLGTPAAAAKENVCDRIPRGDATSFR